MKDFWREVPWQFKVYWLTGLLISLGIFGLLFWAIIKIVNHFT